MQQAVADVQAAQLPQVTGQLLPKAVLRTLATCVAGLAYLHYSMLDWVSLQSVPVTATGEYLESWAGLKGILRQPATVAIGPVTLTGTDGSVIPGGTLLRRADGVLYALTDDVTMGSSSNPGTVRSQTEGANCNCAAGTKLSLTTTIPGVNGDGISGAILGGADVETDDSLRTRMLFAFSNPPQGGAASDYVQWTLQVPGVSRAWATGSQTTIDGIVTIYHMRDVVNATNSGFPIGTDGGSQYEARYPAASGDQLECADWVYPLRPVTALVISAAPVAFPIDITIKDLTPNSAAIRDQVSAAITAKFVEIGSPLGMTLHQSDISSAILNVASVQYFEILTPDEQAIPAGSLPQLRTIIYQ